MMDANRVSCNLGNKAEKKANHDEHLNSYSNLMNLWEARPVFKPLAMFISFCSLQKNKYICNFNGPAFFPH